MSGKIRLKGASSGYIDITAPDSGANTTLNIGRLQEKDSSGDISTGNITTTGYIRGPATFTIDPANHGDSTGTLRILGNLTVDGTTTTINSQTVTTADKNIVIAQGAADSAAADGAGITIDTVDASLTYVNSGTGEWEFDRRLIINTDTTNETYGPSAGGSYGLTIGDAATDSDSICSIKFNSRDAGDNNRHFASIAAQKTGQWADNGGSYPGALTFWTRSASGQQVERMRIDKDGDVFVATDMSTKDLNNLSNVLAVKNSVLDYYEFNDIKKTALYHNAYYTSGGLYRSPEIGGYGRLEIYSDSDTQNPQLLYRHGIASGADSNHAENNPEVMFGVDSVGTTVSRRGLVVGTNAEASAYRTLNYAGITMRGGTSDGLLGVQDGNGRMQLKWNARNGTNETYLVSSEPAFFWDMTITSSPIWEMKYAAAGTADSAISWTVLLDLTSSGDLEATGDMIAYSDERLKENIEIIPNALEKIEAIDGVTFTRKDESEDFIGRRRAGVIAQQVEKVLPEVVTENKEGTKQVAYGNMVGLLVEAIKELKAEIEELKK